MLANIVAHYVIDIWIEETVRPLMGPVKHFRYADDLVICCRYERDAERIRKALGMRLAKYKLKLNEDKTKMVRFSKENSSKGIKQEAFDFLGFTFYLGKSRLGYIIPKLKTNGKRFRSKLKRVNEWAREIRNKAPLKEIWRTFCAKIRGHAQYYGVSYNGKMVGMFIKRAKRIMFKWLNRCSQRKSYDREKFELFIEKHPLPVAKVYHKLF